MTLAQLHYYYVGFPFAWVASRYNPPAMGIVADFVVHGHRVTKYPGLYEPVGYQVYVRSTKGVEYPLSECQFEEHLVARELAKTDPAYPGITLVNLRTKPEPGYDLYIGRANVHRGLAESKWGNPFFMPNEAARFTVLRQYEEHVRNRPDLLAALPELAGKTLACWCVHTDPNLPQKTCHGHILVKLYREFHLPDPTLSRLGMGVVNDVIANTPVGK